MTGRAVTGPAYIGRHRQEPQDPKDPQAKTASAQAGDPGPDGALAAQVIVIAKEPVPGRVKTRLTPPYTPVEAAALAEAALTDTLAAVASTAVTRRVLALDGRPGRWLPGGFEVIGQRGAGLDERIAWALADARASSRVPAVLIGMDTPQVTPGLLASAVEPLVSGAADATFGMAEDGGFWLLGLREIDPALVLGVPMSRADTGARQFGRLVDAGLRVLPLPALTDVDTADDAERIAAVQPDSRFAACLRTLASGTGRTPAAIRVTTFLPAGTLL